MVLNLSKHCDIHILGYYKANYNTFTNKNFGYIEITHNDLTDIFRVHVPIPKL